ncbi:hypothetical protein LSTR_LSTR011678 [Laodelphax striatellus]|uniref:F-box domain-containing protein n=1 Tax=Laodelphax striatellus TaxID=195883 RepID=A0A482WW76_LAOST|nr:hypothetical protein LSTR_LSTR011678 [Laodelphax striatellus]
MDTSNSELDESWNYASDIVLLDVFQYLNATELLIAGKVCRRWNRLSMDEMLWKALFYKDFKIDRNIGIMPNKTSWLGEYKRLSYETPMVCHETLRSHSHQVLHVSFAHNGSMFATTSKDGYIIVWESTFPVQMKFHHDMKSFSWQYTQFSQFNQSDTLLLVSGVHFGAANSTSGEIAVFSLQGTSDEIEGGDSEASSFQVDIENRRGLARQPEKLLISPLDSKHTRLTKVRICKDILSALTELQP